jgi:hypothetical protein
MPCYTLHSQSSATAASKKKEQPSSSSKRIQNRGARVKQYASNRRGKRPLDGCMRHACWQQLPRGNSDIP